MAPNSKGRTMKKIVTFLAAIAVVFTTAFVNASPVSAAEVTYTVDLTEYNKVEADAKKALKDAQAAVDAAEQALSTEMDKWESTKIEQNAVIQTAQDVIEGKMTEIEDLQKELDLADASFADLVEFCESLIDYAEGKKVAANEAITAAEAEITELEEMQQTVIEYEMLIEEANAKIDYYTNIMDEADATIANCKTVMEELYESYKEMVAATTDAETKLDEAKQFHDGIVKIADARIAAKVTEIQGLNNDIATSEAKTADLYDLIANETDPTVIAGYEAQIDAEETKMTAALKKIDELSAVIETAKAAKVEVKASLDAAQEAYDAVSADLNFATTNFATLDIYYANLVKNAETDKNLAYQGIVIANEEINQLTHALEENGLTVEEYDAAIAEVNERIDFYNEYIGYADEEIAEANAYLEEIHAEREALTIALNQAKEEYIALEEEQSTIIDEANAKIEAADAALVAAAYALSDAQDALEAAEDYYDGVIEGGKAHAQDADKADLTEMSEAYAAGYNAGYDAVILNYAEAEKELPAVDGEKDDSSNTTTTTTTTNNPDASPSTGDTTNATTLIALLGASLASAFIIARRKRA